MAAFLKESLSCSCGKEMFVYQIDKINKNIIYRCMDEHCNQEKAVPLHTVITHEPYKYFRLSENGQITWKCHTHGSCEFDIDWFRNNWHQNIYKFIENGCALDDH